MKIQKVYQYLCMFNFLFGTIYSLNITAQNDAELRKYIPYEHTTQETHPTIEIKTVIHIIKRFENDPHNFIEDSIPFLRQCYQWINAFYKNMDQPILPTSDGKVHHVPDSRVVFKIDTILFHQDENDWDRIRTVVDFSPSNPLYITEILIPENEIKIAGKWAYRIKQQADSIKIINGGSNDGTYIALSTREKDNNTYIKLDKKIVLQPTEQMGQIGYYRESNKNCNMDLLNKYSEGDKYALHVFYTGSSKPQKGFGCGPAYNFVNVSNLVFGGNWSGAQLTAHELGHTLGLSHTDYPQFSDLPKSDKFGFIDCNTTHTSNNIMGYNKCRNYLSPLQIGFFHRLYTLDENRIRITTANEYDAQKTMVIYTDTTWGKALIVKGDIVVKRNRTLIIENQVHLTSKSTIYLEKKATILLKDGDITNVFDAPWLGLKYVTDVNFRKKPPKKEKNLGKIIYEGKGTLVNVKIE